MTTLMQQEIFSEPTMLKNTIKACSSVLPALKAEFKKRKITKIVTMARGTSDNAATVFSFLCPLKTGLVTSKFHPSIFTVYDQKVNLNDTMMVIISQSGMSKDTIKVMNDAKACGAMIVGVTNNAESPIAKESDFHLFMDVEEEKSVAATKTYIGEIFALSMLVDALAEDNSVDYNEIANNINDLLSLFDNQVSAMAEDMYKKNNFIILSRGTTLGSGDELSLKLTECCYIFNRSYSSANFMHGPLSLLDSNANVIMFAPDSQFTQEFIDMANRIKEKDATLYAFTDIKEIQNMSTKFVNMPKTNNLTSPIYYGVMASLLALSIGLKKGHNVDAPRNLKKVTVTL